ncbi:MAG TPA: replication-relaxation family protein [Solirubrobacterales bacterium]
MHTQTKFPNSSSSSDSSVGGGSRRPHPLGDRDRELLRLVSEQRMIRLDQLARFLGRRPSEARRIVARLVRDGYAEQERFLVAEPEPWVWLTRAGERASGTGYIHYEPKVAVLAHTAAANEVRLAVTKEHSRAKWVSERALWRKEGRSGRHLADAVLELAGKRHAIEVELTRKWPKRVAEIVAELCERYDVVDYYCTPTTRRIVERAQREYGFSNLRIHDLATGAH